MSALIEILAASQLVCTLAAVWALICRLSMMTRRTAPGVRQQHAWLMAGLVSSLALPGQAGAAALALGVLLFLLYSTSRWRRGAPRDTHTKPGELDSGDMRRVWGRGCK